MRDHDSKFRHDPFVHAVADTARMFGSTRVTPEERKHFAAARDPSNMVTLVAAITYQQHYRTVGRDCVFGVDLRTLAVHRVQALGARGCRQGWQTSPWSVRD